MPFQLSDADAGKLDPTLKAKLEAIEQDIKALSADELGRIPDPTVRNRLAALGSAGGGSPLEPAKARLLDRIATAFERLVTLEIVTVVGQASWGAQGYELPRADDALTQAMVTRIDLVQGDITTVIPVSFLDPAREPLRTFHQSREAEAHQIVKDNLAAVRELIALAASASPKPGL